MLADQDAATIVFLPVEAEGLATTGVATGELWVDYDHDGDLDVLIGHTDGSLRLLRNLGDGSFDDTTSLAGLNAARTGERALSVDFDHDYDVDLFVWGKDGTELYSNQRGGKFMEVGAAVGAAVTAATTAVVAEDLDNDGRIDLVLATAEGLVALRNMSNGTFLPADLGGLADLHADGLDIADFNNDSYLDLVLTAGGRVQFFANRDNFQFVNFSPLPSDVDLGGDSPVSYTHLTLPTILLV